MTKKADSPINPSEPRRNPDGSLFTFTVYGIDSGEPMTADDRTFDEAHHTLEEPDGKKKKGKKDE